MIFAKTHVVDQEAGLVLTDVTIKVCCKDMMCSELKAVISSVIDSEITDIDASIKIAQIMDEEAEKLAARVKDLMEGQDHESKNT